MPACDDARGGMGLLVEWGLAIAVVICVLVDFVDLLRTGGQPQPFIYHIDDSFMDWFNTSWWAHNPGAYDNWRSIYPPISFLFLKLFSIDYCYAAEPVVSRSCDWVGRYTMFLSYGVTVYTCWYTFVRTDRRTAVPRTLAMAFGLPMLYGLERGNLILVAFPLFAMAHAPLLRSARLKWLALATVINFKPYLIVNLLPDLSRRRWLAAEATVLLLVMIYGLTWALFGGGSPAVVIDNIITFSTVSPSNTWQDTYYATSYNSLYKLLAFNPQVLRYASSTIVDAGMIALPALVYLGTGTVAAALACNWLRPGLFSPHRLALLSTSLAVTTSESGGYSQILMLYLALLEPWRGIAQPVAIVACYMLCMSTDYVLSYVMTVYQQSYFLSGYATQHYGVAIGQLLRPGLLLVIVYALGWQPIWRFLREWWQEGAALADPALGHPDQA